MSQNKPPNEIRRLINAFYYSRDGFKAAFEEAAFRSELLLAFFALPIACIVMVTGVERVLLIGSIFLILIVELLNTAIEKTVDRVSTEHHPLSKTAKDMGSAAVLLSLINAVVVWLVILL